MTMMVVIIYTKKKKDEITGIERMCASTYCVEYLISTH